MTPVQTPALIPHVQVSTHALGIHFDRSESLSGFVLKYQSFLIFYIFIKSEDVGSAAASAVSECLTTGTCGLEATSNIANCKLEDKQMLGGRKF